MKAVLYEEFGGPLQVEFVADPAPEPHGVIVQVKASGICRSAWHGWMGHDSSIRPYPGTNWPAWFAPSARK